MNRGRSGCGGVSGSQAATRSRRYIISIYRAKPEEMGRLRFGRPVMIIGDGVEIEVSVAFSSDCLGAAG